MTQGKVYNNAIFVGIISFDKGSYKFAYDDAYYNDIDKPAISLTLPKNQKVYFSKKLFPYFHSLLSEGSNKKLQSKLLKIDEDDYFQFLLKTTNHETIGAIRVEEIIENDDPNATE